MFEATLVHELDERYQGDPLRLSQILNNLLSNALKFTPKGGSIRLELEPLRREGERQWVRFGVSDSGCGIATENQAKGTSEQIAFIVFLLNTGASIYV